MLVFTNFADAHEVVEAVAPLRYFWTQRYARQSVDFHRDFIAKNFPGGGIRIDVRRSNML